MKLTFFPAGSRHCKAEVQSYAADAEIMTSPLVHPPVLSSCISHCLVALTVCDNLNHVIKPHSIYLDCLSGMHKLQELQIDASSKKSSPWVSKGQLTSLTSLESFSFQGRSLQGPVLSALGMLPSLTHLVFPHYLQGTSSLGRMRFTALEDLTVEECGQLDVLRPLSLYMPQPFTSLCRLALESCRLFSQPTPLRCLPSLRFLELRQCGFTYLNWLSEALEGATQVSELHLVCLYLGSVPQSVCSMTGLHRLNLECNELTTLPDALAQVSCLEILDLSDNELTVFPDVLTRMTYLRELCMHECSESMQVQAPLTFLTTFSNLKEFEVSLKGEWDSMSMFYNGLTAAALEAAVKDGVLRKMPELKW